MDYYPAFLDLRGRLVLLVGGGQVAARKLAALLEAGARVRLVAPELHPQAQACLGPQVEHRQEMFQPEDLEGTCLVISATDDEEVNRRVATEAEGRGLFVNVVDVPRLCSFIVPASLRRGDLCLAVSTGGASPAAARRLREALELQFGPEWEPYLRLMRALRKWLTAQGRPPAENRPLFFALADSNLLELVAAGDFQGVETAIRKLLGKDFSLAELGWSPHDLKPKGEEQA
ncbi:MAG: bifunctional precorrin-2 dehydrogenase/sirohydrochlorin ferrochelatase [Desulfarculaceae bacterium]